MRGARLSSRGTRFQSESYAPFVVDAWWMRGWWLSCSVVPLEWTLLGSGAILTSPLTRRWTRVAERVAAGLLDTSVVIDLEILGPEDLPLTVGVSAITMAELAAGPAASKDAAERARRQDRLQRAEAAFEAIPFSSDAARAYGRVHAAVLASGGQPRRRPADLLIAATAVAEGLPLVTRNPEDFLGLDELVDVIAV